MAIDNSTIKRLAYQHGMVVSVDDLYVMSADEFEAYTQYIEQAATIAAMRRCAEICDSETKIRIGAAMKHLEDSESRARCMSAARAATNCGLEIRAEIANLEAEK